jgi:uncharacterized protein YndB with AHSA1/START domain
VEPRKGQLTRRPFITTYRFHAPVAQVFKAIATPDGISTWWDKQTPVQTDRGLVLEHSPGPEHGVVRLRVVESVPGKRVEWECISTHPQSSPASAWTGTRFIFEVAEVSDAAASSSAGHTQGRITALDFRQSGYDEQSEFFGSNNLAWEHLMQHLKQVVESQG